MALVSFQGNVGKVFGLQYSQDNRPRFSFSVAENHGRYDQHNQWQETGTTWWTVTVFGKRAEDLANTVQEGQKMRVTVAGKSQTRFYEHQGEQRQSLDVIADFVGVVPYVPKDVGQSQGGWGQTAGAQSQAQGFQQQGQAAQAAGSSGWGGQTDPWAGGGQGSPPPF